MPGPLDIQLRPNVVPTMAPIDPMSQRVVQTGAQNALANVIRALANNTIKTSDLTECAQEEEGSLNTRQVRYKQVPQGTLFTYARLIADLANLAIEISRSTSELTRTARKEQEAAYLQQKKAYFFKGLFSLLGGVIGGALTAASSAIKADVVKNIMTAIGKAAPHAGTFGSNLKDGDIQGTNMYAVKTIEDELRKMIENTQMTQKQREEAHRILDQIMQSMSQTNTKATGG